MSDDAGDEEFVAIDVVIVMPKTGTIPMVSSTVPVHVHVADEDGNVHCDFRSMGLIDNAAKGMAAR